MDTGGTVGRGVRRWSVGSLPAAGRPSGARGGAPDRPAPVSGALAGRAEATRAGDAQRRQPLFELLGRLAVEGEHEDARRVRAALDELDDAAHQRLGLARPGRREHSRRAARVLDGGALGVVEPDRVRTARGCAPRRGVGRRGAGASAAAPARLPRPRAPGAPLPVGRPQEAADVFEVEPRGFAYGQAAWLRALLRRTGSPGSTAARARPVGGPGAGGSPWPAPRTPPACPSSTRARPPARRRAGSVEARRELRSSRAGRRSARPARPQPPAGPAPCGTPPRRRRAPTACRPGPPAPVDGVRRRSSLAGGPVSAAAFTAEEASRHPRPRRG